MIEIKKYKKTKLVIKLLPITINNKSFYNIVIIYYIE